MNTKLFIISIIIILIVVVLAWYIITKLTPTIEPLNQNNSVAESVIDDKIEDITSDLNKVADDSAATTELNTLDEQLDNF